jgi:3-methyladenine DNA glycosylase AlkC
MKSVANNLSDLSKKNPSLILKEISDLASMNDRNSYSIAYRASRNLVKENPLEIMNILKINEYKYKNKKYSRSDYQ